LLEKNKANVLHKYPWINRRMGDALSRPQAPLAAVAFFRRPISAATWFATPTNQNPNIQR
jgi:hypothetical protein